MKKIIVVSDVDGCLTDGTFIYTKDGKVAKVYGPHDNDGVKLLQRIGVDVEFISADKRGYPITKRRIEDMKCKISNISEADRLDYISSKYDEGYDVVVFFGDGLFDARVKTSGACDIFIAPANARREAKAVADFVTESIGGQGAFLDLALWVEENLQRISEQL